MATLIGHIAEYSESAVESVYTSYAQELLGVDEYGAEEDDELDDGDVEEG